MNILDAAWQEAIDDGWGYLMAAGVAPQDAEALLATALEHAGADGTSPQTVRGTLLRGVRKALAPQVPPPSAEQPILLALLDAGLTPEDLAAALEIGVGPATIVAERLAATTHPATLEFPPPQVRARLLALAPDLPQSAGLAGRSRPGVGPALPLAAGGLTVAIVLALALAAPVSPLSLTRNADAPGPASQTNPDFATATPIRTRTSRPSATPTRPAGGDRTPTSTAAGQTATPVAAGVTPGTPASTPPSTPAPTGTSAPSPTPTSPPSATATPTACAGVLDTNVGEVNVATNDTGSFTALNKGCGNLPFTATASVTWLSLLSPASQVITGPSNQVAVNFAVDRAKLPEGSSTGQIVLSASGGAVVVNVRAQRGGAPPAITLASATCSGGSFAVSATAVDDVAVQSVVVEYSAVGGGTSTSALALTNGTPSNGIWQGTVPGAAAPLRVVAQDGLGQAGAFPLSSGTCP